MPDQTGHRLETRPEAWIRRRAHADAVDFTMMYVAHDAFDRDLVRLHDAASTNEVVTDAMRATWAMFSEQLDIHHTAEDEELWPPLMEAAPDDREHRVLEAMEAEHETLDPMIDRVDAALVSGDLTTLATELAALRRALSAHMAHEEDEALPLVERRLGQAGWDAFGRKIRDRVGGMSAGARYLPWILEDADDQARPTVLAMLPFPARILCRRVWEPRFRASGRL